MKSLTILYLIRVMFCNKFQLVPNQKGEACQRRTRIMTAIRLRWALSPLQFLLVFPLALAMTSQDLDGEPLASDDDMDNASLMESLQRQLGVNGDFSETVSVRSETEVVQPEA